MQRIAMDLAFRSPREQHLFSMAFAHELTVINRGIWSDDTASPERKVELMKQTNEMLHRVANRLFSLVMEDTTHTDESTWSLIEAHSGGDRFLQAEVQCAIRESLARIQSMRTRD